MKRTNRICGFLTAVAATLLLTTSCNDSYPGLNYEPNPDDQPKNDEDLTIDKTPIKIYTNNPGYFSLISDTRGTRGTGALEDGVGENYERYLAATFHVFAFRADNPGGQGVLTTDPFLTYSAYCPEIETGRVPNDKRHSSCLLDGEDYMLGMPFKFVRDDSNPSTSNLGLFEKKVGYDLYWPDVYQDVGYNFFGYHIDDFTPVENVNAHRTNDAISYDIDLDGYRDIIMGYAQPLTEKDFAEDGIYPPSKTQNLTDEEREKILATPGSYSTYAAHRNINPIISMRHQLAFIKFKAYAGAESAKNIRIDSVGIYAPTKATMYVATKKLEDCRIEFDDNKDSGTWAELQLSENGHEYDADGNLVAVNTFPGHLKNEGYAVEWNDEWNDENWKKEHPSADDRNPITLGAGLLVPPEKSYKVRLHYYFYKGSDENPIFDKSSPSFKEDWEEHETQYIVRPTASNGENSKFEAGNLYTIKIAVYGLEKITMGGSVESWKTGGEIEIDPDNPQDPDDIVQKARRK